MLPHLLADVVSEVGEAGLRLGVHAHNDRACAVANSLTAIAAGATHVQGTANGYGERCGNADVFSVVAALEVKLGRQVLPEGRLAELGRVSHAVAEVANIAPEPHQPWVGASAFAHKAGLHVSAIKADPDLYQHCDPAVVGNDMRLLVSELAGRATIEVKGKALGLDPDRDAVARLLTRVKDLESIGYSFEAAEASFELLLREEMGERPRSTTRCARRSARSTRAWPGWTSSTTRCASSAARTAPTPSRGCWSRRATG
jgi:2-isopropylmalate synthase